MKITKFTDKQIAGVIKTGVYIALSAVLSAAIVALSDSPEMFGIYTPIINIILVTAKKAVTEGEE